MENLIRIKLDPKRGGSTNIDFKRPCFRIYDWENSEVEIWFSSDNGSSWDKLSSDECRYSYDFELKQLYVSLEFDIDTISQLAFFAVEGQRVGVGFDLTRYNRIQTAWTIEGSGVENVPVGTRIGSVKINAAAAGHTIQGVKALNIPCGFNTKTAFLNIVPVGYIIADPEDFSIQIGYQTGQLETESNSVGARILGVSEYQIDFLSLDETTITNLSSEAAWHKQKNVTLDGTDPEDLD